MAKGKQKRPYPSTGNDFIELAEKRGAVTINRGTHTKVRTKLGATYIVPGDKPLDKRTVSNLTRWYRLLGLMALVGVAWGIWWIPQYLGLV